MSKHKVKRYDGEEDSMVEADAMEEANKGENLDTEAGPKAINMPRRPVSRTPMAEASRMSGPGRKPSGPSRADYSNEGKGDSKYRKQTMTPESQALEAVHPETMLMPGGFGIKGVASAAQTLARTGAKEAPAAVSAARGAMDRAMSAERAAPKTGDMSKINDALKAFKNKPAAKSAPKPKPKRMTEAERMEILRADTLKAGGKVKGYASGGSVSSRADGIAQRGKTRGTMVMCGGGMAKGRK